MPVEFNPKSLRTNHFSYKELEIKTPLLPLSHDVVHKTIAIFNFDVEKNKERMELEMMADQPHLHTFLSYLTENPYCDTRAYREGALKTYTIFTNQAYENQIKLPEVPVMEKALYEKDFDMKFNKNENFTSLYNRVVRDKVKDIIAVEPGLNQPLTSRDNYGPYRMSFAKGVVDTYYAMSKTISGRALDEKFGMTK